MKLSRRLDVILIGTFGFIGANARYLLRKLAENPAQGIFLINMAGCLLTGIVSASKLKRELKVILGFGFIGAFTTYSGIFSLSGKMVPLEAAVYVVMQLAIALPMIYLGRFITGGRKSS